MPIDPRDFTVSWEPVQPSGAQWAKITHTPTGRSFRLKAAKCVRIEWAAAPDPAAAREAWLVATGVAYLERVLYDESAVGVREAAVATIKDAARAALAAASLAVLLLALASTAFAGSPYEDAALAAARTQGLKAADVLAKGYAEIAALAGVKLGPKGESPAKFFYAHVRRDVARILAAEETAVAVAAQKVQLDSKIKLAFPDAEVEMSDDGEWKIKKLPPTTVATELVAEAGGIDLAGTLLALGGAGAAAAGGVYAYRRRRAVA